MMSNAERFEVEPPPYRPGRSTGSKILLGCGIGCGVLMLLCCGGIGVTAWLGYEMLNHAVDRDPARVQAMTDELATMDIPAGLKPRAAIDMKLPVIGRSLLKAVAYTDKDDVQILAFGEFSGDFGAVDHAQLRREIERALENRNDDASRDDDFRIVGEPTMLELEIRGEPAHFRIEEGEGKKGRKLIRAAGDFEGHTGTALLFLQLDADSHSLEDVEDLLRSIR